MALKPFLIASLAAQAFALPASHDLYYSVARHEALRKSCILLTALSLTSLDDKRDDPSSHAGDGHSMESMPSMSHGAGEQKPGSMSGMSGGMGGGGMGGGLSDFFLQSSMTQPLLNAFIGVFPAMPMTKKDLNKPSTFKRPGAKKANLWFGPFEIVDAATRKKTPNKNIIAMDPGGTTFMNKAIGFPSDITLLDAVVHLVYEDGSPASVANGIYNHHIAFQDTTKKPPAMVACPGQAAKNSVPTSVFVATGEDGNSYHYAPDIPDFNSGYYIGPNDGIGVFAEIVNYTNQTKKIFASVEYNYVPGKPKYDVSGATLSVTQCDGANVGIHPPKGQKVFEVNSKDMKVEMDGYIFAVRGHLHDGGDYVGISVNNKSMCQSKAIYGGATGTAQEGNWQTVSDMSVCKEPFPVKKGDTLKVTAKYDLQAHPS
jgi:hypothetical protein